MVSYRQLMGKDEGRVVRACASTGSDRQRQLNTTHCPLFHWRHGWFVEARRTAYRDLRGGEDERFWAKDSGSRGMPA
jgi:hypothetical protein